MFGLGISWLFNRFQIKRPDAGYLTRPGERQLLSKGFKMNCYRCGGVMTREQFYSSHDYFWGWRCIACGEILDEIILANRRNYGKRRDPKVYEQGETKTEEEGRL